jgi:predicted small secreted protein
MKRNSIAVAATAVATFLLSACTVAGAGDEAEQQGGSVNDGSYVLAADGTALFTLELVGGDVTVTREDCSGIDPTDTGFGSLDGDAVTWDVTGAFTEDEKGNLRSARGGEILKLAGHDFFAEESTQGSALREHFESGCASGGTDGLNATDPDPTSDPGSDENEGAEPSGDEVSLRPESGILYLRAVQQFSPQLERWVFDEAAGTLGFVKYNCIGQVTAETTGSVEQSTVTDGTLAWAATWEGQNPHFPRTSATSTRFEINEHRLMPRNQAAMAASSNAEAQQAEFVGMCRGLGEAVARFVL